MHVDPGVLALLAFGEPAGSDDERAHALSCADCAQELDELQRVVGQARDVGPEAIVAPADHVWGRIVDELSLTAVSEPLRAPTSDRAAEAGPPGPAHTAPAAEPGAQPARRLVRAKVAGVLSRLSRVLSTEFSAGARLTPVGDAWSQASGTAQLVTDELGRQILHLALSAELPASGVRQAWLMHRDDHSQRQTVGILDGLYGMWTIDHSIDLDAYAILDISQQQSGDLEHSGQSIVRGELVAAAS